ncbi:MAG: right-handed parallel beta-helix repeat-containing protein [Verrucomicrobiales bacterium]
MKNTHATHATQTTPASSSGSRSSRPIASAICVSLAMFVGVTALAQGPLTPPPGAPAPAMKTLLQIEPRTDLQSTPPAAGVNTGDASYHFIINQPGSYYLSANLGVTRPNGIQINAEGVTLHLSGFEISRTSGTGGHAIEIVPTAHRTRIGHGAIKGFAYGVRSLEGVTGGFADASGLDDLAVGGCPVVGILVGDGATLEACRVRDCGGGINTSTGCALTNCTATRNTGTGMTIESGSSAVNCVASANGGSGIILSGTGSVLRGCVANSNQGSYGIFASQNANLTECTASNNTSSAATSAGISAGTGSVLTHCTASFNFSTAALTSTTGMGFTLGSGSMIRGCVASENKGNGIRVSENCAVRDNQCNGNGRDAGIVGTGAGVHATGSDNRIEGNNVTNNDRGIDVDAAGNLIIKNSASGNTGSNYSVVVGNFLGTVVATEAAMNASTNSNSNISF